MDVVVKTHVAQICAVLEILATRILAQAEMNVTQISVILKISVMQPMNVSLRIMLIAVVAMLVRREILVALINVMRRIFA